MKPDRSPYVNLAIVFVIMVVVMTCQSCGPAALLRRADRLTDLAIKRGAVVKKDTLWKKLQFNIKGPKIAVNLRPLINSTGTGYSIKDTVITVFEKGTRRPAKAQILHDTLYIDCPDSVVNTSVPVAVNTEIKSGFTNWQHYSQVIGGILFGIVLGALLGRLLWR